MIHMAAVKRQTSVSMSTDLRDRLQQIALTLSATTRKRLSMNDTIAVLLDLADAHPDEVVDGALALIASGGDPT